MVLAPGSEGGHQLFTQSRLSKEITTIRDREHKQPGNMLYLVGEMENTQDNKDLGGAELFSTALRLRTVPLFIKLMFVRE